MAYVAPYIDNTGIHIPSFAEIRDSLIEDMKGIFGNDIYLDEDSMDYQQISIMAKKIYDNNSTAALVYNNRTANTAIGVGLDNLCALVGIKRVKATYSFVQVTITGRAGTKIRNGQVSDEDGEYLWNLPANVTIPSSGSITVEAQCNVMGQVIAQPNSITKIATPIYGWYTVTNEYASEPGADEETDANLRARFYASTLIPSTSIFDSMIASLKGVQNVDRVKGYENDTNETSAEGLPPHSVTFVVEYGEDEDIADIIYRKKTPGCYTNGTTEVNVMSDEGNITVIRFYRPTYKNIYVKVNITKLANYNASVVDKIKEAVEKYVLGVDIHDTIYRTLIISEVVSCLSNVSSPEFSVSDVQLSTDGETYSQADVECLFNEAAFTDIDKITVEVT